jgi:hypothetical protein
LCKAASTHELRTALWAQQQIRIKGLWEGPEKPATQSDLTRTAHRATDMSSSPHKTSPKLRCSLSFVVSRRQVRNRNILENMNFEIWPSREEKSDLNSATAFWCSRRGHNNGSYCTGHPTLG